MNIFDVHVWVKFKGGVSVCFRTPEAADMNWAMETMQKVKDWDASTAEYRDLVNVEIPKKLMTMAIDATTGNGANPPNWSAQLGATSLLCGHGGLEVINLLFFRSLVLSDEEGA